MANTHLQGVMNKEVSRKEFLGIAVVAVGSILGLSTIMKLVFGKSSSSHRALNSLNDNGYGK